MDGQQNRVGGEANGPPGGVSHCERAVGLCCKGVEVGREGCSTGGSVSDEERDGASSIDIRSNRDREDTVGIPKNACRTI